MSRTAEFVSNCPHSCRGRVVPTSNNTRRLYGGVAPGRPREGGATVVAGDHAIVEIARKGDR